jgi:hypothetical protein
LALAGVEVQAKGRVSADIASEIEDGRIAGLSGTIKGEGLDITGERLKGDRLKTGALDVNVRLRREKELINIERLRVDSDWVDANVSGTVPTTFESLAEFVRPEAAYSLSGSFKCDLGEAMGQMPHLLGVREGVRVTSGELSGQVATSVRGGKKQIIGSGKLAGLAGTVGARTAALSEPVTAEVRITSGEAGIEFDKLDVSGSFAKINCRGSTDLLKYKAEVDLAKLQSELGQFVDTGEYKMSGQVSSSGEISGSREKIAAVGTSQVRNFSLSSKEGTSAFEPKADMDFSVTVKPDTGIVDVNFVRAKATLGEVYVENSVVPFGDKAGRRLELAVSARDIELRKAQPFAGLFVSFPKGMELGGVADSNVLVRGEKEGYHISTDGTRIRNLEVTSPGQKPFKQAEVLLVADGEINPDEKTYTVEWKLVSPQINIKGSLEKSIEGSNGRLEGQADCEYDWSAVSAVASAYLPGGLRLEGHRKDKLSFSSEYPSDQPEKMLAKLNTKAKVGFERAEYMGLKFGATEVAIEAQEGVLNIAPFSAKVNGGTLNFAGNIDFKEKPMALRSAGPMQMIDKVNIDDEVSKRLLVYINPIFADASRVTGVADFHCETLSIPLAAEKGRDIKAIGTVSMNKLRFEASDLLGGILAVAGKGVPGQDFTIRPTRFILWDGFVRYDDMQIDVGDNPINFTKAVIGLDRSYDMTVILPWTLSGRTARVDEDVGGERIKVRLKTGAGEKPQLDLGVLLEAQLKQRLEDALQKGLEELFK